MRMSENGGLPGPVPEGRTGGQILVQGPLHVQQEAREKLRPQPFPVLQNTEEV